MLLLFCEDSFGARHAVEVSEDASVRCLKEEVGRLLGIGKGKQQLVTEDGEPLGCDEELLSDIPGITDMCTLLLSLSDREVNKWLLRDKGIKRCFKSALAAAEVGDVSSLSLLKASGVDLTQRGPHGLTVLMAGTRHQPVVDFLVASGSVGDVEARDSRGNTALILACWNETESVVKTLVEHLGADVSVRNQESDTPLTYAVMRGHCGLVQYLYRVLNESNEEDLLPRVKAAKRLARTFCQYDVLNFLDGAEFERQQALVAATPPPAKGKSRRREKQLAKAVASANVSRC